MTTGGPAPTPAVNGAYSRLQEPGQSTEARSHILEAGQPAAVRDEEIADLERQLASVDRSLLELSQFRSSEGEDLDAAWQKLGELWKRKQGLLGKLRELRQTKRSEATEAARGWFGQEQLGLR